ncbi:tail assembly protein [Salmonella enterica subsp. enterica serovar Agona str. SL483]|uniref:tail assembly protein n=1 Tax=Salmonella enterica TaxID=28901 RepID=UPI0009B00185|nr:tail assembly protein [Salmonella enterica]EBO3327864.1 tail assembly protein [Salmonella enterica subsp. enterica serovar Agona]ECA5038846.1 tail assembly protein [Salmonella enterica subsp. enterica serovar Oranienburg]ECG1797035.1 tail assembly protein [Salmonella enterica subsp. enterica serovar Orion]MIU53242.1 tail assembly protein [Salmonella enterica subsp. enterica serovar Agona str. SL483]HEB6317588.1 tail assembly protein [Salmonella enterica subsp. enterica serovar Infantis]HEB
MLIFKFAGSLRRFYRQIPLNVDTPAQGLRLLLAQNHEFKKAFLNTRLRIRIAGEDVEASAMQWHLDRHLKDGSVVLFVPVVEGAITAAAAWIAVAVSVASIAYSVYMSRNMKTKTSAEAAETNTLTNNSFTSAENRVGQGRPVPILIGEMEVGSNVISLGIDTSNNQDWTESIS